MNITPRSAMMPVVTREPQFAGAGRKAAAITTFVSTAVLGGLAAHNIDNIIDASENLGKCEAYSSLESQPRDCSPYSTVKKLSFLSLLLGTVGLGSTGFITVNKLSETSTVVVVQPQVAGAGPDPEETAPEADDKVDLTKDLPVISGDGDEKKS